MRLKEPDIPICTIIDRMIFGRLQRKWTLILVFYCLLSIPANASSLQSSNMFDNLHLLLKSDLANTTSTVLTPSPSPTLPLTPRSLSPSTASPNDDDWYYSYQRRPHNKPTHNISYTIAGVNSNNTSEDDCFDRYGTGGLGQLACQGKKGKIKINHMKMEGKEKPRMMMNGMSKSKVPKVKSKKCDSQKAAKSCLDSTVPSMVPSSVPQSPSEIPKKSSTFPAKYDETAFPTSTNVPSTSSSPTASTMPSNVILPTEYPTFENTKQESPSLPPELIMPTISPSKQPSPGAPVRNETRRPTLVPSRNHLVNTTGRPSSTPTLNSDTDLLQRATPFGLTYGQVNNDDVSGNKSTNVSIITSEHIMDVRDITIEYLEDYLDEQFFGNSETIVESYISSIESVENGTDSLPVTIVYNFGIAFDNASTFILTQQEVDVLIESGFRSPFVDVLITTIQQLDHSNPFSSATSIVYVQQSELNTTKSGRANDDLNVTTTAPPVKIDDKNRTNTKNETSAPVHVDDGFQSFDTMISQYERATVKVSPFILTYKWIGHNDSSDDDFDPTIGEIKAATNITLSFLDQYLHMMLDLGQPGVFEYFVGYGAGMIYEHNVIEFRAALQFQDTSMFTSIQNEVDMIIQTAFIPHYAEPLIQELQSHLPKTNPFSKTIAVSFGFRPPESPTSKTGLPTLGVVALAMAVLLVVAISTLILIYRYHKWYKVRRQRGVPKIIIHSNHDPIHGDLIEIISSDEPDENYADNVPTGGLSSMFTSMHQRLMTPLEIIDDNDEMCDDNSTIGSMQYKTTRQYRAKPTYSDGWSSTSSSTSTLSATLPLKYTEPKIFEDID